MRLVTSSGTIESSGEYVVIHPKGDKPAIYLDEELCVAMAQCTALLDFFLKDFEGKVVMEQLQFASLNTPEGQERLIFTIQLHELTGDYYIGYASHPSRPRWGKSIRTRVEIDFLESLMRILLWRIGQEGSVSYKLQYSWLLRGVYADGHAFIMTDRYLLISDSPENTQMHVFNRASGGVWTNAFDAAIDFLDEGPGSFVYGKRLGRYHTVDIEVLDEDRVEIEFWGGLGPHQFSEILMHRASGLMDYLWRSVFDMLEDYIVIRDAEYEEDDEI